MSLVKEVQPVSWFGLWTLFPLAYWFISTWFIFSAVQEENYFLWSVGLFFVLVGLVFYFPRLRNALHYNVSGSLVYGFFEKSEHGSVHLRQSLSLPRFMRDKQGQLWERSEDGVYRKSHNHPRQHFDKIAEGVIFQLAIGGWFKFLRKNFRTKIISVPLVGNWELKTHDGVWVGLRSGYGSRDEREHTEIWGSLESALRRVNGFQHARQPEEDLAKLRPRFDSLAARILFIVKSERAELKAGIKSPYRQHVRQYVDHVAPAGSPADEERWDRIAEEQDLVSIWISCGPQSLRARLRRAFQLPEPEAGAEAS